MRDGQRAKERYLLGRERGGGSKVTSCVAHRNYLVLVEDNNEAKETRNSFIEGLQFSVYVQIEEIYPVNNINDYFTVIIYSLK